MPSGSFSLGGICTGRACGWRGGTRLGGIAPAISLPETGVTADRRSGRPAGSRPARCPACSARSAVRLPADRGRRHHRGRRRCRCRGLGAVLGGRLCTDGAGSVDSICGICGALPVSSSVIAIWKVPSTITTTLAPTSSERILEVMVEGSLPSSCPCLAVELGWPWSLRGGLGRLLVGGAAAAACAARRAAAMKLDELTGSLGRPEISLIALSEAAIRSTATTPVRSAGCPAPADDPAAIPARSQCAAGRRAAPGFR